MSWYHRASHRAGRLTTRFGDTLGAPARRSGWANEAMRPTASTATRLRIRNQTRSDGRLAAPDRTLSNGRRVGHRATRIAATTTPTQKGGNMPTTAQEGGQTYAD